MKHPSNFVSSFQANSGEAVIEIRGGVGSWIKNIERSGVLEKSKGPHG